jgi:hypothetical protein
VQHGDAMQLIGCDPTCTLEADALGTAIVSWPRLRPDGSLSVTVTLQALRPGRALWSLSLDANADGLAEIGGEPYWDLTTIILL